MDDAINALALALYIGLFQSSLEDFVKVSERIDSVWLNGVGSRFQTALDSLDDPIARAKLLYVFAVGIWEKGYEAAPKLEFVVTEEK